MQTTAIQSPHLLASDPSASVWVSASAGTGKTTALVGRVVRILLAVPEGEAVDPSRILCITYTKAAASEMHERLMTMLARWALLPDDGLQAELERLGEQPNAPKLARARSLFLLMTDHPTGMRIQTIHSFCQALLARFPLEACLPAGARLMDETESTEYWKLARLAQQQDMLRQKRDDLVMAEETAFALLGEYVLHDVLEQSCYQKRAMLRQWHVQCPNLSLMQQSMLEALGGHPEDADVPDLLADYLSDQAVPLAVIRQAIALLEASGVQKDAEKAAVLSRFLLLDPEERAELWEDYCRCFLTAKYQPLKSWPAAFKNQSVREGYIQEASRLADIHQRWRLAQLAEANAVLGFLGADLAVRYDAAKAQRGMVDYDDVISLSRRLLESEDHAWVRYRLDGGFDHILLDEAQDTTPEQWQIVQILSEGLLTTPEGRSLFVVGDAKQSIYSFQGANPEHYQTMYGVLAPFFDLSCLPWRKLPFQKNYRSAETVLGLVDVFFAEHPHGMGADAVEHLAHRKDQASRVVIWPPVAADTNNDGVADDEALEVESPNSIAHYADQLAETIYRWIHVEQRVLASRGRVMVPGDVMILLQRRQKLAAGLIAALKAKGLPVAGLDRLSLAQHLAVKDLIALAAWALSPEDDMQLALVLRSPWFGISDAMLHRLAYGRDAGQSLWQRIQQHEPLLREAGLEQLIPRLQAIVNAAHQGDSYRFYHRLLWEWGGHAALQAQLGAEIPDICQSFLDMLCHYQRTATTPSLRGFVGWMGRHEAELKRDSNQQGDQIRILTVHGAKGLQAPVVILADATAEPGASLLPGIHHHHGLLPLLYYKKDHALPRVEEAASHHAELRQQEHNRLLYVAMTRAEDELYIGGMMGKKKLRPDSWYARLYPVMAQLTGVSGGNETYVEQVLEAPHPAVAVERPSVQKLDPPPPPAWLTRPTVPLEASSAVPAVVGAANRAQQEGVLFHQLLESLPRVPKPQRMQVLVSLCQKHLPDASAFARMVEQASHLLHHADFAWLWQGGMAEVPLMVAEGGGVKHYRVDWLYVDDRHLRLVDFKTTASPPDAVPEAYIQQLGRYGQLACMLWPGREVELYVLWTAIARLDRVAP